MSTSEVERPTVVEHHKKPKAPYNPHHDISAQNGERKFRPTYQRYNNYHVHPAYHRVHNKQQGVGVKPVHHSVSGFAHAHAGVNKVRAESIGGISDGPMVDVDVANDDVYARDRANTGLDVAEKILQGKRVVIELEEAFEDSDSESTPTHTARKTQRPKLNLPLPRGRIRTLSGTVPPVGYAPHWGGATMCVQCMEFFDLPRELDKYVGHLLNLHQIQISEMDLIVDLKRYNEHWRKTMAGAKSLEALGIPKVTPGADDPLKGQVAQYYLLSPAVAEDRKLRERLALRRLEEVLSCQQREREDSLFTQQCLFCRYIARGNRSKLIHHLYMIHHLNLGSPDNLVFVAEYLDVLRAKITACTCIYCEKEFADHAQLMEHMRKRAHREVNPHNHYYDKFYIINYLELGKKWLEVLAEDFEDHTPALYDSDEEEEEETWAEWQMDNIDGEECLGVCLFCDQARESADDILTHMKDEHNYDLMAIVHKEKMNFYDRTKFINFIRKASHRCVCFACGRDDLQSWQALRKHFTKDDHVANVCPPRDKWAREENLVSLFDNDHLLWMLESTLSAATVGTVEDNDDDDVAQADKRLRAVSIADALESDVKDGSPVARRPQVPVIPEDLPDIANSELKKHPEVLETSTRS